MIYGNCVLDFVRYLMNLTGLLTFIQDEFMENILEINVFVQRPDQRI